MGELAHDFGDWVEARDAPETAIVTDEALYPYETDSLILDGNKAAQIGPKLAEVIRLPLPDFTETEDAETTHQTAPTAEIDINHVKRLLDKTSNDTYPDKRIRDLLGYAWNNRSPVERVVPSWLIGFVTDSPPDWYAEHKNLLSKMLAARGSETNPLRYDVEYILEDTKEYESCTFLSNARRINFISMNSPEGEMVELSARLILQQAIEAKQASSRQA